jgi:AraC-like DNA-binding protein
VELVKLAVSLSLSHPIGDIVRVLGIPQSSLYRWLAQHKKYPLVERTETTQAERQQAYELAEVCASYGFDVQQELRLLYGARVSANSPVRVSSSHPRPNREFKLNRAHLGLNAQQARSSPAVLANPVPMANPRFRQETVKRLSLVKAAIDARYFTAISCHELGNSVSMSRFSLIKRFTAMYGVSPYRYLQSVRVRNAKSMLISVNRPVDDIATAVGFESASSLVRAFKSIEGISLSTYCRGVRFSGHDVF